MVFQSYISVSHSSQLAQSHISSPIYPVPYSSPIFQSHIPVKNPVHRLETPINMAPEFKTGWWKYYA